MNVVKMNESKKLNVEVVGDNGIFGKLTVEILAKAGHRVIASMRGVDDENAKTARELLEIGEREGASIDIVEMDITDETSINNAVKTIIDSTNHIDVQGSNAGIYWVVFQNLVVSLIIFMYII